MATTNFIDNETPVVAAWLNDVDEVAYTDVPALEAKTANLPTVSAYAGTLMDDVDAAAARTTLGAATAGALASSGITGAAASGANTDITSLSGVTSINGGQLAGFRNRLINGDMRVAQRGTPISSGVGVVTYTLDRWIAFATGAAVSITADVGDGNLHQKALAITGATSNTAVNIVQRIEANIAYPLAGKQITVSARIYTTSTFTPTWSVDSANASDNFTTTTAVGSGSFVSCPATGWTDVSFTVTLNAACQNGFQISFLMLACPAGVTKGLTGVQLELGSTATTFEQRSYGLELLLCQRYYQIIGHTMNTTSQYTTLSLLMEMRAIPTIGAPTFDTGTGATFTVMTINDNTGRTKLYQATNHSAIAQASLTLSAEL